MDPNFLFVHGPGLGRASEVRARAGPGLDGPVVNTASNAAFERRIAGIDKTNGSRDNRGGGGGDRIRLLPRRSWIRK